MTSFKPSFYLQQSINDQFPLSSEVRHILRHWYGAATQLQRIKTGTTDVCIFHFINIRQFATHLVQRIITCTIDVCIFHFSVRQSSSPVGLSFDSMRFISCVRYMQCFVSSISTALLVLLV